MAAQLLRPDAHGEAVRVKQSRLDLVLRQLRALDLEQLCDRDLRRLQAALLGVDDRIIRLKARRPSPRIDEQRMEGS